MEKKNIYSADLIVENQIFNSISLQVICPICNEVKLNPKMTTYIENCQYTVCGECSKKLLHCPICRKEAKWVDNLVIKKLLTILDFKCYICEQTISYKDLSKHYEVHTQNNGIKMPNSDNTVRSEITRLNIENRGNGQRNNQIRVYNNNENNLPRNRENNNINNVINNNNSNGVTCGCLSKL